MLQHISEKTIFRTNSRNLVRINCNKVPIRGPDSVPAYNPYTDNGGCFITKQLKNNCYAYGNIKYEYLIQQISFLFFQAVDIVTILILNQVTNIFEINKK